MATEQDLSWLCLGTATQHCSHFCGYKINISLVSVPLCFTWRTKKTFPFLSKDMNLSLSSTKREKTNQQDTEETC